MAVHNPISRFATEPIEPRSDGTVVLASSDAEGRLTVSADDAGFVVTMDDAVLARELAVEGRQEHDARQTFVIKRPESLTALIHRVWQLSRALPDAPLKRFEEALAHVGEDVRTEVEALVRRRLGQTEFRAGLLDYWQGRCAVTGIAQPELLRASHIKPWAHCENNAERLNVHNGFLLTADWDAAFDAGLVTFNTSGAALFSPALSKAARARLGEGHLRADRPLAGTLRAYLAWHFTKIFKA
ncbi:HNH endonuclease signature motif containing protein [Mesorhizobium sp. M1403]|uniref:HNH endonuclease n=1 Tax=Mesorhizobium sp. M1403 TaxID=2957097 RepID=UPI00333D7CE1